MAAEVVVEGIASSGDSVMTLDGADFSLTSGEVAARSTIKPTSERIDRFHLADPVPGWSLMAGGIRHSGQAGRVTGFARPVAWQVFRPIGDPLITLTLLTVASEHADDLAALVRRWYPTLLVTTIPHGATATITAAHAKANPADVKGIIATLTERDPRPTEQPMGDLDLPGAYNSTSSHVWIGPGPGLLLTADGVDSFDSPFGAVRVTVLVDAIGEVAYGISTPGSDADSFSAIMPRDVDNGRGSSTSPDGTIMDYRVVSKRPDTGLVSDLSPYVGVPAFLVITVSQT
jgi:hypothetical protein